MGRVRGSVRPVMILLLLLHPSDGAVSAADADSISSVVLSSVVVSSVVLSSVVLSSVVVVIVVVVERW
jgi:hypothetical protein